ncbi:conjugal transfer protein TraF [Vibrio sp. JC009]|uniref:conjugal transfer protein TraF n=1 Tax=Vibrio sp. JC009 TaxID=2912314 RepID=UPI0023AFB9D1|nr:conjugal transfer protein TraF [Vibrio sp. JC009]WED24374.1 conjugal transfer protein TraF [Vibrio sp. JC009]
MNKLRFAVISALTLTSYSTFGANYAVDARGDAMGGVGVVAATYLTAPFYNPALTAIYRRNDDVGMLLPSFGLVYDDSDLMVDNLDTISDNIDALTNNTSSVDAATVEELNTALNNLQGSELKIELGAAAAFGIPNPYLSMTAFGKLYTESYIVPDVWQSTESDTATNVAETAELTAINAVSVGVAEAGLSIARYSTVFGQHMSFGFSPKIQRIYTYAYTASAENYDVEDIRENDTVETAINLDAGALWFYGPLRVGLAATNLIPRDIDTKVVTTTLTSDVTGETKSVTTDYSYQIRPQYTVGVGFVADYFSLSVDYDLTEDERFVEFDDNIQWFRAGMEIDIFRQLYLRAGYKKNMAYSDSDDVFTAGIGLSPLGLFELDVAVSYVSEDSMGGYVNFLATY